MPAKAFGTEDAEAAHQAHGSRWMALHHCGAQRSGEHDEVAFRARRPVEHQPLVVIIGATDQPARIQAVSEAAGVHQ